MSFIADPARLSAIIAPMLGRPYRARGRGPDAFDCGGWVEWVQRECAGRIIVGSLYEPPRAKEDIHLYLRGHPARLQFVRVERPVHGCVVEMASHEAPFHLGVYLAVDGGVITHCTREHGVTIDGVLALRRSVWRGFYYNDWRG